MTLILSIEIYFCGKIDFMKKLHLNQFSLLILILVVSCISEFDEKAEVNLLDSNILRFENSNQMLLYFNEITNETQAKLKNEIDGFVSFKEEYLNVVDLLEKSTSSEKHDSILYANSNLVELRDSVYLPKIENPFYQLICNKDGFYVSENKLHKVISNDEIAFTDLDYADLLLTGQFKHEHVEIVKYSSYEDLHSGKVKANCGSHLQADYFSNSSGCKNDRRVYIRAYSYYAISGNQYTPMVISEAWAEIRNWLCNWKPYDTELKTRNCSFTVSAFINGQNLNSTMSFPDRIVWSGSIILHNGPTAQPVMWQGGQIPTIQFTSIHEESSSRGVGLSNWAVIHCQ
jgi:hypothetical protein